MTHAMISLAGGGYRSRARAGDLDAAERLIAIPEALDRGQLSPFLKANAARLRARLEAARGVDEHVEERFRNAAAQYREFGFVFHHAVATLEHAEWLVAQERPDEAEPLLAEARETFERLGATLDRARRRPPAPRPRPSAPRPSAI